MAELDDERALHVASFLHGAANALGCRRALLDPIVGLAFMLFDSGVEIGDQRAHDRTTLVAPPPEPERVTPVVEWDGDQDKTPVVDLWRDR